jgi:hypothetical protein
VNLFDRFVQKHGRLPTEYDPDYLEMLRMSKYRILPVPDVNPAKCANCGSCKNDGRGYVDFGLQVDWYGVVYLCTECLRDIAEKAGLFRALELKIVQLEEEVKHRAVDKLTLKNFEATVLRTFEEVRERFVDLHSTGDDIGTSNNASVDSPQDESSKSGTDSTEPGTETANSGTTKQTSGSGRKDVLELADLLKQKPQ